MLSASGLLLEVALTRLFSALFYPPSVFIVLSLAVLGIGIGAALATWKRALRNPDRLAQYLALGSAATATVIVFAVRGASLALGPIHVGLVLLPYICVGLALATFFSSEYEASHRLYLADLLGAGLGAVIVIPVLNGMGPVHAGMLAAVGFGLAGLPMRAHAFPTLSLAVVALTSIGLLTNWQLGWLQLDMAVLAADKPLRESLEGGGRVIETEWDAFARTDLVDPGDGGPYRLYMDGAAGSVVPPAVENEFLLRDIGLFPFATGQPRSVFIIGPGGGLDVWFALQIDVEKITAVEVNGASVQLVERFRSYHGGLYADPAVQVVVDEGRSVLRREGGRYDLIFLSQVVTLAAERSGYALTENTVFTVEAFHDYLDHLTDDGQIAVKLYDEPTLTRALITALTALKERGLSDAEALRHTAAILDPRPSSPVPLLLVRASPIPREESLALGQVARRVGFAPLYLPETYARPPLDAVEGGSMTVESLITSAQADVSPTTDDRPFFYQFERGVPQRLRRLLLGLASLVIAGTGALAAHQRRQAAGALRWYPLYFGALGFGFMAIEVALIQQSRLFLGHPTLAVTTVLAVLLVGGGVGSGLSKLWTPSEGRPMPFWPPASVAALTFVWYFLWPLLRESFLAAATPTRVLVVGLSVAPLALFMGMPFPLGLKQVGDGGEDQVALGWAVNGVMTVVGSAGAVALALLAGFSWVLVAGAVAYGLAALVAWRA